VGTNKGYTVDLTATADPSSILVESELEDFSSPVFDKFSDSTVRATE
jgi:hypothetical protein